MAGPGLPGANSVPGHRAHKRGTSSCSVSEGCRGIRQELSGKDQTVKVKVPVSGQALVMGLGLELSRHWKWEDRSYVRCWELQRNPGRYGLPREGHLPQTGTFLLSSPRGSQLPCHSSEHSKGHLKGFMADYPLISIELTITKQIGVGGPGSLSSRCPDGMTVPGGGLRVDKRGLFAGSSRVKKTIYISLFIYFLFTLHPNCSPPLSSQFPPYKSLPCYPLPFSSEKGSTFWDF